MATPVTVPRVISPEAIVGSVLLHVPPDIAELKVEELPIHAFVAPRIGAGLGLTIKL